MTPEPVYILGGAQSDFARNWTRDNKGLFELISETTQAGLEAADAAARDVDVIHIGNFAGELFCGQGLIGGMMAHVDPDFEGKPTSRHEAACASGSMAIMAAMADIGGWGRDDAQCSRPARRRDSRRRRLG